MSIAHPLRLGFIGGSTHSAVGYTHFVSSRMDGRFSIDAGCFSRVPATNAETAVAYGVEAGRMHGSWQSLLEAERERLDAVVVLTPTPTHAEIVVAAIEAGYPVICEKALAVSVEECARIRAALDRRSGFLAVTFNYSGYPMVRELRRLIADGELGRLQQIHVEMPQEGFLRTSPSGEPARPQDWRLTDPAIPTVSLDLGVHVHHLVQFLSPDSEPREVVAEEMRFGHFKAIVDNVHCLARYSDDLHVQMWYGKTALGQRNGLRIRVYGDRGSAEWHQMDPEVLHLARLDGTCVTLDRGAPQLRVAGASRYTRFKAGHPAGFLEAFANLYVDIAEALKGHLRGGGPPAGQAEYVYGIEQAVQGFRLLEAVSGSARARRWLSV